MKKTFFALLIAVVSGIAFAADEAATMTLEEAQQASGKSADEVKAADANGDGAIDSSEFAALSGSGE